MAPIRPGVRWLAVGDYYLTELGIRDYAEDKGTLTIVFRCVQSGQYRHIHLQA